MRTVHTYTPTSNQASTIPPQHHQQPQQQQQHEQRQEQQQQQQSSSSSTSIPTGHSHSSMNSSYSSARYSLLRMHSQLRSAPQRRETNQDPIDLSQNRTVRPVKVHTRSATATSLNTTIRTVPIITSLSTAPTHTIYTNIASSTTSLTSGPTESHSGSNLPTSVDQLVKYLSSPPPAPKSSSEGSSPKLAYAYSNIEENLQCPLCIDRLRDPRALPCQHVFCCACLKSIPLTNLPYQTISCPLCRRTFPYNGADQFPVSYIHRQLLELVPKNYDINGKCTKCQDKTSLSLCSCCDYLLCKRCYENDREKVNDNIRHCVQTFLRRLQRIHQKRDQINDLAERNRKKIQQVENLFENFERKFFEHKQSILRALNQFNEQIPYDFWTKLKLSVCETTTPFSDLLVKAQNFSRKSQTNSFDDVLSLMYNLNSADEQLERASSLLETFDVENLLKQNIEIDHSDTEENVRIRINSSNGVEQNYSLLPSTIFGRRRKTSIKEKFSDIKEICEDDDDIDFDEYRQQVNPSIIYKRMKTEDSSDIISNPNTPSNELPITFTIPVTNEQNIDETHDNEIIYLETIQGKSSPIVNLDDLFQIIGSED